MTVFDVLHDVGIDKGDGEHAGVRRSCEEHKTSTLAALHCTAHCRLSLLKTFIFVVASATAAAVGEA